MNIRNLNKSLNATTQTIILAVLSILFGVFFIVGRDTAYDIILGLIIVLLVLAAVWILFINPNYSNFASYFSLLALGFINGAYSFLRWFFSLNIKTGFRDDFPWLNFIVLFGAIYLIIMLISILLDDGFQFNKEHFKFDQLFILFPVLIFLNYGFNTLLTFLVIEFIAYNYSPRASHFLMLSKSIVLPFSFFRFIYHVGFSFLSLGDWLFTILAFYVIFLILKDLYIHYKHYKNHEDHNHDENFLDFEN